MKLYIAGGVGEHGRNCFLVEGSSLCFLVDCGMMSDTPDAPYPRLTDEQIRRIDAVFLTHSHADHTGALPWLNKHGFDSDVIASTETLRQLPFAVNHPVRLEDICPDRSGCYRQFGICWGRTGHCAGSVWFRFEENGKAIFFSGDYTEDACVYACDIIRHQSADLAVVDCAYGLDDTTYETACSRLVCGTEQLLASHKLLLFPVPKYGRGLELLSLLSCRLNNVLYYADACFLENLTEQQRGSFWYRPSTICAKVNLYHGESNGIVFVSDPQLRGEAARRTAQQVLSYGGMAVMTGTVEKGSHSESLLQHGQMTLLRYPVHLNICQYRRLLALNNFEEAVPYHSSAFQAWDLSGSIQMIQNQAYPGKAHLPAT